MVNVLITKMSSSSIQKTSEEYKFANVFKRLFHFGCQTLQTELN